VLNTAWPQLADYTRIRDAHFAALASNVDAVYHPDTNTITLASAGAATVIVTGATAAGATTYGTDHQSTVVLAAGCPGERPGEFPAREDSACLRRHISVRDGGCERVV